MLLNHKWKGVREGGEQSDHDAVWALWRRKVRKELGSIIKDYSAFLRKWQLGWWWRAFSQNLHARKVLHLTVMVCTRILSVLAIEEWDVGRWRQPCRYSSRSPQSITAPTIGDLSFGLHSCHTCVSWKLYLLYLCRNYIKRLNGLNLRNLGSNRSLAMLCTSFCISLENSWHLVYLQLVMFILSFGFRKQQSNH